MSEAIFNQNTEIETEITKEEMLEPCFTFESGGYTMFLSTKYVTQIINIQNITLIPLLPSFIKGVINLRGSILPVVDIRLYMGKTETEYTSKTCIIVLDVNSVPLGIIVDSVQKVLDIDLKQVHPIPLKKQQKLLNGMIKIDDENVLMSFDSETLAAGI